MANTPTIRLRLRELMEAKGIESVNALSRDTRLSRPTCVSLIHNRAEAITFPVLAKLCLGLGCTPNDLMEVRGALPAVKKRKVPKAVAAEV